MNYYNRLPRGVICLPALLALSVPAAFAQVAAAPAPTPAVLAKYDLNRNGVLDPSESATLEADQRKAAAAVETKPSTNGDEPVTLSPFEVVSDSKGYYATNTMSGTRFNSKLEDLGASITVMTKEQMADFAMLDINDVFLYTANAEGTGTYTAFEVNRNGDVQENVSNNPAGANRVRGIAPANISMGNFETMGRTPVDPLGIDAVEISRGPNASVFGLGNPSGTVNMVPSSANLTRDRTSVVFRGDSYGGYRASLDTNRVIKKGVLSLRLSGSFQHDDFQLQPAGVNSIRYNAYVKYQPFKNTTISAAYSIYRTNGNRPNASPLRDNISYWIANGRPTWDPVAQVIHVNGQTLGPFPTDTGIPDVFNRSFTGSGRTQIYVGNSGIEYMSTAGSTQSTNPGTGSGGLRLFSLSAGAGVAAGRFSGQPLFTTTPVVRDRSIYDYTKTNLTSVNRLRDRNITGSVTLEQIFLNSQRQTLALQVGFLREDSKAYRRDVLGNLNQNGQSSQLLVDINERRLDGSPNPFFLRPYVGVDQPYTLETPQKWDSTRGQVSYKLDLTKENNALRWLGVHQVSIYDEFKYRVSRRYSYQELVRTVPGLNGVAVGTNIPRGYFRYYIGDNVGNNVDYSPNEITPGSYNFIYGNPTTGFVTESTAVPLAASTGRAGGGNNSLRILKTFGGVLQSQFFSGRVVTTFGKREDKQYIKNGATPVQIAADGVSFNYDGNIDHWTLGDYRFNSGRTTQKGVVVRPLRNWTFVNNMARSEGAVGFAGKFMNGLSLHYNESDSFTPEEPRFNLYEQVLPNPAGEGKDWGFSLALFDNKFVIRVNKYENKQIAARNGDAATFAQRVTRIDFSSADPHQLANRAVIWTTAAHPDWTEAQINEDVGRQMGMPWEQQQRVEALFNSGRLSSPNDILAKGTEIELNFNPTNYWTVQASATDTQSMNTNVSKEIGQWISERMPYWTTVRDLSDGALWWTKSYGGSPSASANYAVFVGAPYSAVQQSEGTASPQIRRYKFNVSSGFQLSGITQQKYLKNVRVTGAVRWQDKAAIGYYGKNYAALLAANQPITELDRTRPVYDKAQYFFDLGASYRTRLFSDKINASFQLNVRNLTENGKRLQPIGAYPDGTAHSYRIVDPRQFILQATFDL
ncbi:MAG: TonB-dependent receptor [Opitutaceae bacterium]